MDRWVANDGGDDEPDGRAGDGWFDDDLDEADVDPIFGLDGDLSAVGFDERYDPDVLAAIEARTARPSPEPVSRLSQWTRRSALGAVFTGMALGLQEVFDPEEERSIVIEVDDDGVPQDLPVQMILDPDSPSGSLCIVHRTDVPPPVV